MMLRLRIRRAVVIIVVVHVLCSLVSVVVPFVHGFTTRSVRSCTISASIHTLSTSTCKRSVNNDDNNALDPTRQDVPPDVALFRMPDVGESFDVQSLSSTKDESASEMDLLKEQLSSLIARVDEMKVSRDAALTRCDELSNEMAILKSDEFQVITTDNESKLSQIQNQCTQLQSHLKSARADKASLQNELQILKAETSATKSESVSDNIFIAEIDAASIALDEMRTSRDAALALCDELSDELSARETDDQMHKSSLDLFQAAASENESRLIWLESQCVQLKNDLQGTRADKIRIENELEIAQMVVSATKSEQEESLRVIEASNEKLMTEVCTLMTIVEEIRASHDTALMRCSKLAKEVLMLKTEKQVYKTTLNGLETAASENEIKLNQLQNICAELESDLRRARADKTRIEQELRLSQITTPTTKSIQDISAIKTENLKQELTSTFSAITATFLKMKIARDSAVTRFDDLANGMSALGTLYERQKVSTNKDIQVNELQKQCIKLEDDLQRTRLVNTKFQNEPHALLMSTTNQDISATKVEVLKEELMNEFGTLTDTIDKMRSSRNAALTRCDGLVDGISTVKLDKEAHNSKLKELQGVTADFEERLSKLQNRCMTFESRLQHVHPGVAQK